MEFRKYICMHTAKIFAIAPKNDFEMRHYTVIKGKTEDRKPLRRKGFSMNKKQPEPRAKLARGLLYIKALANR